MIYFSNINMLQIKRKYLLVTVYSSVTSYKNLTYVFLVTRVKASQQKQMQSPKP